ncbi:MAG: ATP-dependent DNA helicase RecG [Acidimicrobiales bacterium]
MTEAPLTFGDFAAMSTAVLRGVGEKRAAALAKADIVSVLDLLTTYPRRYLDRTREARLADLEPGEEAMALVRVRSVSSRRTKNRKTMTAVEVSDGEAQLRLTFFNQPWRERQLHPGAECVVFGRLELFAGRRQMTNPVVDLVGNRTGRIVPVYPQSEKAGITSWDVGDWIEEALRRSEKRGIADPAPSELLRRYDLISRGAALTRIHRPASMAEALAARRRLVFDELLRVQLALVLRKRQLERSTPGIRHTPHPSEGPNLLERFWAQLPFPLTGAQRRAVEEINADLAGPHPMHRLLQGDVGAGKTVVAVSALLVAVQGGMQGALMAPTEVLAEQHHLGIRRMLEGFSTPDPGTLTGERPLRIELLTHRTGVAERRRILGGLASGAVELVVGTHALIQERVEFAALGVAVIDEQHRFGVEQRAALRAKSASLGAPDVLVMTATPIPRTAAMTVYGDLDVSILDELPPGRTPIETRWEQDEAPAWEAVRAEVGAGRQAYVVCPLVDESDKLEAASAEETFARLAAVELSGLRLGLLHGRVPPADKEQVMAQFRAGRLDVLVATTVIEVGVDVPNATVMVILDADRFGISQLHQLRGRVGRGEHRSVCWLIGEGATPEAEERLSALVRTTDGFELAEVDLELRGEGTLMGERQTGRNDLKLASLRRDREWVERAREAAFELVGDGTALSAHPALAAELELFLGEADADFLLKS